MGIHQSISDGDRLLLSRNWVNKNSYYYKNMKLKDNIINCFKDFGAVFGVQVLKDNFQFSVRVDKIGEDHGYVAIGIAENSCIGNSNVECGFIYFNKGNLIVNDILVNKFQEFCDGDIITVFGNFSNGKIGFRKNWRMVGQQKHNKLKSVKQWVPFIMMESGGCVSLVENMPEQFLIYCFLADEWYGWDDDLLYETKYIILNQG